MRTYFVTSSGTEIGKTFVTCELVRQMRGRGDPVRALKPVVSGVTADSFAESDTAKLMEAMDIVPDIDLADAVSRWRFQAALSPDMAALREGRSIPFNELVDHCLHVRAETPGTLMIEGVGGVMVPLGDGRIVLDWMEALKEHIELTPILIVGSYLGTISHTLTALLALRRHDMPPRTIIVSESEESPVPLEETVEAIRSHSGGIAVHGLPRLAPGQSAPIMLSWLE